MVLISYTAIKKFIDKHPEATDVCNNWYRLFENADCNSFHEMKNLFNSVDSVGNDRYVFNVGGGNYRIEAMIFFDIRTVFVRKYCCTKTMIELRMFLWFKSKSCTLPVQVVHN